MPMDQDEVVRYITEALPDAQVEIECLAGDNDHLSVKVVSKAFEGKSRVQQHKMVYDALKGHVGGTLHALAVKTAVG